MSSLLGGNLLLRYLCGWAKRNIYVLGIETSCDDTGIAIVDSNGNVRGNALNSQQATHSRYGGIIPPRAQEMHRERIAGVFEDCMREAEMRAEQLDAIAVTTKPGLPMSLRIGLRFAKHLARKYNKPLIAVHHMEAHALQARMEHNIPYPFLCLLISGGHCQLAVVRGVRQFELLGCTLDDAPGEAFDKIARRLRLFLIPKYRTWSGGQAIEDAAAEAVSADRYEFPLPCSQRRDCNFSFAGFKNNSMRAIRVEEIKAGTPPDGLIPGYKDFCAGLLRAFSRHLMHRTQRALEYCLLNNVFAPPASQISLVVSGGVANNYYIFSDLTYLAQQYNCRTYRPSRKYCSDNGVMIAWNGIEQIITDESCLRYDYDNIDVEGKANLGISLLDNVESANLKCKWVQAEKRVYNGSHINNVVVKNS